MADPEPVKKVTASNSVGLLGLLYLIVAANFVEDLFSCDLRRTLASSLVMKHAILLLGAVFWVAESYVTDGSSFAALLAKAAGVYVLFVMSTKSQMWSLAPMLVLIICDQLVRLYGKTSQNESAVKLDRLERVRIGLQAACVLLIMAGFLSYAVKQHREHGADFRMTRFMLGTLKCRDP